MIYTYKLPFYLFFSDPVYVIVEYMSNGNLKTFLRKSRNQDKNAIYSNLHGISVHLTLEQLLNFALQTATGMEYLSSQKVFMLNPSVVFKPIGLKIISSFTQLIPICQN